MTNAAGTSAKALIWILLGLVAASSMSFYTFEIWSAGQPEHFSDLYARWWGAHELFLHGRDPYSPEVSHEIQTTIYGAAVAPSPDDPAGIGGGFAYPPFTAFLLWPTIYVSFPVAEGIFLCLSILLTVLSMMLWARFASLRLTPIQWTIFGLFLFGSFPVLQGLKLLNLSLIAAAFVAIAIYLLSRDRLIPAGIFLALSTFKPQFVCVLVPWLALWTFMAWRRRQALAWSFVVTMLALSAASELVLPGGLRTFVRVAGAYQHYTYGHSLLDIWFTPRFGPVISAALLVTVVVVTRSALMGEPNSPRFVLTISMLLAGTLVVIPTLAPHAQLLLLPGILCLMKYSRDLWRGNTFCRMSLRAAFLLLAWPWLASVGLILAHMSLPVSSLLRFWEVPLYASPVFPLACLLALSSLWGLRKLLPAVENQPSS
jgi:hypothetical protein